MPPQIPNLFYSSAKSKPFQLLSHNHFHFHQEKFSSLLFFFVATYGWWWKTLFPNLKNKLTTSAPLWIGSAHVASFSSPRLTLRGKAHIKSHKWKTGDICSRWPQSTEPPWRLFKTINSDSRWAEVNNHPFKWELVPLSLSKSCKHTPHVGAPREGP